MCDGQGVEKNTDIWEGQGLWAEKDKEYEKEIRKEDKDRTFKNNDFYRRLASHVEQVRDIKYLNKIKLNQFDQCLMIIVQCTYQPDTFI